jgi:hypothetical protein
MSRQFLLDNRNSRYSKSRGRSAGYRRAARRGREDAKLGENANPARPTDNLLISLETAKEKVWKSLEKFGNPRNFLGISLEKFGNPGKSLAPRRHDTQTPKWPVVRWRAKPSRRGEAAENRHASR